MYAYSNINTSSSQLPTLQNPGGLPRLQQEDYRMAATANGVVATACTSAGNIYSFYKRWFANG